jgi:tRNA dimethylallyltransferase
MKIIPIIVGPTSTGKTSLAIELCKKTKNAEIVSADSRQVYKHMDIGTGKQPVNTKYKISKREKHWKFDDTEIWGYDLTTPDKYFSGVDFTEFALEKVRELQTAQKTTFVVGGTGFYIDLLTGKSKPSNVLPDLKNRKKLEKLTLQELLEKLMSLNPTIYEKTDKHNKIRIIRAIERETSTKKRTTPLPYLKNVKFVYFGLNGSRDLLYTRVDNWLETIWKDGLLGEVENLIDLGFGVSPKLTGLVYRSALSYIKKERSSQDAIQEAKYDLHAYIRRQLTWFRKYKNITWFDISVKTNEEISEKVLETLF